MPQKLFLALNSKCTPGGGSGWDIHMGLRDQTWVGHIQVKCSICCIISFRTLGVLVCSSQIFGCVKGNIFFSTKKYSVYINKNDAFTMGKTEICFDWFLLLLGLEPQPATLRNYSWLCAHKSPLAGSGDHMECQGSKPGPSWVGHMRGKQPAAMLLLQPPDY